MRTSKPEPKWRLPIADYTSPIEDLNPYQPSPRDPNLDKRQNSMEDTVVDGEDENDNKQRYLPKDYVDLEEDDESEFVTSLCLCKHMQTQIFLAYRSLQMIQIRAIGIKSLCGMTI